MSGAVGWCERRGEVPRWRRRREGYSVAGRREAKELRDKEEEELRREREKKDKEDAQAQVEAAWAQANAVAPNTGKARAARARAAAAEREAREREAQGELPGSAAQSPVRGPGGGSGSRPVSGVPPLAQRLR